MSPNKFCFHFNKLIIDKSFKNSHPKYLLMFTLLTYKRRKVLLIYLFAYSRSGNVVVWWIRHIHEEFLKFVLNLIERRWLAFGGKNISPRSLSSFLIYFHFCSSNNSLKVRDDNFVLLISIFIFIVIVMKKLPPKLILKQKKITYACVVIRQFFSHPFLPSQV